MITDIAFLGIAVDSRQLKEGGQALDHFTGKAGAAEAKTRTFQTAVEQMNRQLANAGTAMKDVGGSMTRNVTLPLVGLGIASAKMAASFESVFARIETLVGLSRQQVEAFRGDVLRLSAETGRGPQELALALEAITSSGLTGSEAIDVLEASAKAATIGLGETSDVARALTGVLQAYASTGLTAAQATDQLIAVVQEGAAEASSLAPLLGRVSGLASVLGVSFAELGGNIAAFTRLGVSAEEAVTGLRGILGEILKPSTDGAKALAMYGMSMDDLRKSIRERGLAETLIMLTDAFRGNEEGLAAVFGNVRGLTAVLGTAGVQAKSYLEITRNITGANNQLRDGFIRTSETIEFKFEKALSGLKATGIELGAELFPVLEDLFRMIQSGARWFSELDDAGKSTIVTMALFAAAAGPVLSILGNMVLILPAIVKGMQGLAGMSLGPWVALAAVVAGGTLALTTYAAKSREAEAQNRQLASSVDGLTEAFKRNNDARPQLTGREIKSDMYRELDEIEKLIKSSTGALQADFDQVRRAGMSSAKTVEEWAEQLQKSLGAERVGSAIRGLNLLIERQKRLREDLRITNDLIDAEARLRQAEAIYARTRSSFTKEKLDEAKERVRVLREDLGLIQQVTTAVQTQAGVVASNSQKWKQYESIVDDLISKGMDLASINWEASLSLGNLPLSIADTNEALREMTVRFEEATDPKTRERIAALIQTLEQLRDGMAGTSEELAMSFNQIRDGFAAGTVSISHMDRALQALNKELELTTDPKKAREIRTQITEINRMRSAFTGVSQSAQAFGQLTSSAFEEAILSGRRLSEVIRGLARDIAQLVLRQTITNPLADLITGALGGLMGGKPPDIDPSKGSGVTVPFAKGGVFSNSVVSSPTLFPMGLMGEAGPEAIVPLKRTSDGSLGVSGGKTVVNVRVDNRSGSEVMVTERPNPSGGADITFEVIDRAIAQSIERGGATGRAIGRTFGLGRQTINRG